MSRSPDSTRDLFRGPWVRHRMQGVTLVEALVAVTIAASLLALAGPGFTKTIANLQTKQLMDSLVTHMLLAQSEAIKRNARVVICKSVDGLSCAASGGWEHGWIVFHDPNDSGTREPSELMVRSLVVDHPAVRINGNANISRYVSYTALGSTRLVNGAFQAGTFTLCHATRGDVDARRVIINSVGRVRVSKVSASDHCLPVSAAPRLPTS